MRERKEMIQFSRSDLEHIAKSMAKLRIVGNLFVGHISNQTVEWNSDDGLSVVTTFQESTLDEVTNTPAIEFEHKHKKRK